jgi:hypothetical protein
MEWHWCLPKLELVTGAKRSRFLRMWTGLDWLWLVYKPDTSNVICVGWFWNNDCKIGRRTVGEAGYPRVGNRDFWCERRNCARMTSYDGARNEELEWRLITYLLRCYLAALRNARGCRPASKAVALRSLRHDVPQRFRRVCHLLLGLPMYVCSYGPYI